jgi:hypothetical protein
MIGPQHFDETGFRLCFEQTIAAQNAVPGDESVRHFVKLEALGVDGPVECELLHTY